MQSFLPRPSMLTKVLSWRQHVSTSILLMPHNKLSMLLLIKCEVRLSSVSSVLVVGRRLVKCVDTTFACRCGDVLLGQCIPFLLVLATAQPAVATSALEQSQAVQELFTSNLKLGLASGRQAAKQLLLKLYEQVRHPTSGMSCTQDLGPINGQCPLT